MAEFKHLNSSNPFSDGTFVTIASGPVIIKNGEVLLDKHDDDFWKFPGGAVHDDNNFMDNAKREVKEELGLDVELSGEPYVITFTREYNGRQELVILIHYLATIIGGEPVPGRDVTEWAWHKVNSLPLDCALNIKPVVEHFTKS